MDENPPNPTHITASGKRSVAIGGNMGNSNIVTGDQNQVQTHAWGIGNVIGNYSTSVVQIIFSPFSVIRREEGKVLVGRNPRNDAVPPWTFLYSQESRFRELENLIGRTEELKRLTALYERARNEGKGAFVFVTGQHGYGVNALGRAFADIARRDKTTVLITRFWEENIENRTFKDPRWRDGFQDYAEVFEEAPPFLKTAEAFPFWGLFWGLCSQKRDALRASRLPMDADELPAFLRDLIIWSHPLVIVLENFEHAAPLWVNALEYLAPEVADNLPILFIISMHSEKLVSELPPETLTPAQRLALALAAKNWGEVYHLGRLSRQDVEDYLGDASSQLVETLYRLSAGLPMLVQELWREWQNKGMVQRDKHQRWQLPPDSELRTMGSGRDYVMKTLKDLWPEPDEAPWDAKTMLDMLTLAAREGMTFTPEAIANAFNVRVEDLIFGLEYLLDEEDDPGLVKYIEPVRLRLESADWQKDVERFTFSPPLVWYVLRQESVPAERLLALAEGLRRAYWPFPERCASKMAELYEQGGEPARAAWCRSLLRQDDRLQALIVQAELLLSYDMENDVFLSRLWDVARQIVNQDIWSKNPQWGADFYARVSLLAGARGWQEMFAEAEQACGGCFYALGEYAQARAHLARALEINEALGSQDGIAACLRGLGEVAYELGEYVQAQVHFARALEINEALGRQAGVAACLYGLGGAAYGLGEYAQARAHLARALEIEEALGRQAGMAICLYGLGVAAYELGEYAQARAHLARALEIEEALGRQAGVAACLEGLGEVAYGLGEYAQARAHLARALEIEEALGRQAGVAVCLEGLGWVAHELGEYAQARAHFARALEINEALGRQAGIADCLHGLGRVAHETGDLLQAQENLKRAIEIYERIGQQHRAQPIREQLQSMQAQGGKVV